jgi:hypothetical protein
VSILVDDLVSSEEAQDVVVVLEALDNTEDLLALNHDECASIFNAAGIYMILDVSNPLAGGYLDRSRSS